MTQRTTGHKIAFSFAILCLIGVFTSLGVFSYFHYTKGMMDVLTGSALATVFFFASCSFVLYYISRPPKHELLPWDAPEP